MTTDIEAQYSHLVQFLYACPVGLMELLDDGAIATINPHAMKLLMPLTRDGQVTNFFSLVEPVAPEIRQLVAAFTAKRGTVCEGHRIFVHSGSGDGASKLHVLSCTLTKLGDARYLVTLADVSPQILQEKRLREAEIWFASLLDGVKDFAVVAPDVNGDIESVSASITQQTGYSVEALTGMPLSTFYDNSDGSRQLTLSEQLAIARRDGWHLEEGWNKRQNGEPYWCLRLIAVRTETSHPEGRNVLGYTAILRNVARKDSDIFELKRRLSTDQLTGAYNRGAFFDMAERERASSIDGKNSVGLIALDIDHFKGINDTHGHGIGDAVLAKVSRTCMGAIRSGDIFARLGGEEFAVLLPNTDATTTYCVAEKIRTAIAELSIDADGQPLKVTASFGCTTSKETSGSLTNLLASADAALYTAKRNGRNRTESTFEARAVA